MCSHKDACRCGESSAVARPSRSGGSGAASQEPDRDGLATPPAQEPERDALATPPVGLDTRSLQVRAGENFPHWTCDSGIYHVCFRLADSIPATVREGWLREREAIVVTARQCGRELSAEEEKRLTYLYSEKIGKALDAGHGACWLAKPKVAATVSEALRHFDGDRYGLCAWCIMPNHWLCGAPHNQWYVQRSVM